MNTRKIIIIIGAILILGLGVTAFYFLQINKTGADTFNVSSWIQSNFSTKNQNPHTFTWGQNGGSNKYYSASPEMVMLGNYLVVSWAGDGTLLSSIYTASDGSSIGSISAKGGRIKSVQFRGASSAAGVSAASFQSDTDFKNKCLADKKFVQAKIVFYAAQTITSFQLTLNQGYRTLSGTIYDNASKAVLEGAAIIVNNYNITSNGKGNYTLNLPSTGNYNSYGAGFSKEGYVAQTKTISNSCDKSVTQDIYLAKPVTPPPPSPAPTVNLKVNGSDGPITVDYDSTVKLSWTASNADSCSASGGWSGAKGKSGEETSGQLTTITTFTLTCSRNGSSSDSVSVGVNAKPTGDNPPPPPDNTNPPSDTNPPPTDNSQPYTYNPSTTGSSDQPVTSTDNNSSSTPIGPLAGPTAPKPSTISQGTVTPTSVPKTKSQTNKILLYILIGLIVLAGGFYLFLLFLKKRNSGVVPTPYLDLSSSPIADEPAEDEAPAEKMPAPADLGPGELEPPKPSSSSSSSPSSPLPSNMPSTTDKAPPPDDMSID